MYSLLFVQLHPKHSLYSWNAPAVRQQCSESLGTPQYHSSDEVEKCSNERKALVHIVSRDVLSTVQCRLDEISKIVKELQVGLLACEPRVRHARWLWRSGKLSRGGLLPWEYEALNSSPELFVWRPKEARITTTCAGLYRIAMGIFTQNRVTIQLCVQGEPIFTLEPQSTPAVVSSDDPQQLAWRSHSHCASQHESHILRRSQHPKGQITCLSIDEFLALPAPCDITIRFDPGPGHNNQDARQAFLAIKKV